MQQIQAILLVAFNVYYLVQSAKILGIINFPSKSHNYLMESLLRSLSERGHRITSLSPLPFKGNQTNYEHIEVPFDLKGHANYQEKFKNVSGLRRITFNLDYIKEAEANFLNQSVVKNFLKSDRKFDLVILNFMYNSAHLAIAQHFDVPVVLFSSFGISTEINYIFGNPAPLSITPNLFLHFPMKMTFWQRMGNAFLTLYLRLHQNYFHVPLQRDLVKKHFPKTSSYGELYDRVSLSIINTHYSIEKSRPYMPNMIQIGGFHIKEAQQLSNDLKTFLDEAEEGVVYFSLGSNIKTESLPTEICQAIMNSFAQIPERVLWKFDGRGISNIPPNVKIGNWFPQTAILAHPNTKLFITQGGLLSITESLHYGVPILGIPFYADQNKNVANAVQNKYGRKLAYEDLTEESFNRAVKEMLRNSSYRNSAKRHSVALTDRPLEASKVAGFWIEYVLRHGRTHFLKSESTQLSWYEYHSLDVVTFLIIVLLLILYGCYTIFKFIFKLLKGIIIKLISEIKSKTE